MRRRAYSISLMGEPVAAQALGHLPTGETEGINPGIREEEWGRESDSTLDTGIGTGGPPSW